MLSLVYDFDKPGTKCLGDIIGRQRGDDKPVVTVLSISDMSVFCSI